LEIIVVVLGLIFDRLSKVWALKNLSKTGEIVVIKNIFSFEYLENRGAAFGVLQNKTVLLSIITLIIVCIMIYYIVKNRNMSLLLRISFSLIISGALGNLFDRIVYKYVVDFITFHYKDIYYFPTFNVADMMVVVGTFLLGASILKEEKNGN
jgi:signal peptidase II